MSQRTANVVVLTTSTAVGAVSGALYSGGVLAGLAGTLVGLAAGLLAVVFQVRSIVAIPVGVGAAVGCLAGKSIAHVLCLPSSCVGIEAFASVATALGAAVGVGLVVALTATSLDEYRAARDGGAALPEPGCEAAEEDPAG